MAQQRLTLGTLPTAMVEALRLTVSWKLKMTLNARQARDGGCVARAFDARRQRIIISQSR
jgi:hypothetical protein